MNREDHWFHSCLEPPFHVYGLTWDGERFRRMPQEAADTVSEGVSALCRATAGGRVRFRTNSPYVAIRAEMDEIARMSHFALTGTAAFDLYYKEDQEFIYAGTFIPPLDVSDGYESALYLPWTDGKEREILIHFPLYSSVKNLRIKVNEKASLKEAEEYSIQKPVVFYGSSITQGGCASRPGTAYTNILARRLDMDYINLGFSGNARGEDAMAEYIAGLSMSVFVYDYDHNAPTVEHLRQTHEKMFERIRRSQPDLPVIMISRPKVYLTAEEVERRRIIETTWRHARENGDPNVYWIDGSQLLRRFGGADDTVDNIHPTDLGFMCMAEGIGQVLKAVIPSLG